MVSEPAAPSSRTLQQAARVWIIGTGLALVLVIASLLMTNTFFQRRMVHGIENDQLALQTQGRLLAWAIAVHETGLEREVVRLARSADLKEAMAAGERARLLEQLEPPLNRLRKGPLAITRLTLYGPDRRLLLHAHDPDGAEGHARDERPLLRTATDGRRIVKGLAVIGGVPHLVALSPIYQDGKFIGVLETGTTLAPIAHSLSTVTGAQVGLRLPDGRVVGSLNPEIVTEALRRVTPTPEGSRHVVENDQRPLIVTLLPLVSFAGRAAGHLTLLQDGSRTIATLQKNNAVTFVIAFVGCAVAGGLLLLLSRRLHGLHTRFEQLYASVDEHRTRAERRAAGLAAVSAMTRSIASAQTPAEAASAVATAASAVLAAAVTRIWIEGAEPGLLSSAFAWGTAADPGGPADIPAIPVGSGMVGRVFASRMPVYRVDVQEEAQWLNPRFVRDAGLHAYAGLPLIARGRIWGVMSLLFTERREFTAEEKELMMLLADSVAIALGHSRAAQASFPVA